MPLITLASLSAGKAQAAPISPGSLSVRVAPEQLVPAQAGYVFVGGAYPLEVSVTLDGSPLDVFWSGEGYIALIAFNFDAPPGDHTVAVIAKNPINGDRLEHTQTVSLLAFSYPLEQVALPYRLIPLLERELNLNELNRLNTIYSARTNTASWEWPFVVPVPGGVVTSRFGGDRIYNGGMWNAHHTGIDFRRTIGEPVQSAAAGRVVVAELFDVRGNLVIVDHGHGVFSQYAHLAEFYVRPGQVVRRGELLGAAGATGRTNGPHLHFEVIVNGFPIDPLRWLALVPNFVPPREITPKEDSPSG